MCSIARHESFNRNSLQKQKFKIEKKILFILLVVLNFVFDNCICSFSCLFQHLYFYNLFNFIQTFFLKKLINFFSKFYEYIFKQKVDYYFLKTIFLKILLKNKSCDTNNNTSRQEI